MNGLSRARMETGVGRWIAEAKNRVGAMVCVMALAGYLGVDRAWGAVANWVGPTAGVQSWGVAANWSTGRVPGVEDDVRIQGNVANLQVVFRGSAGVRSLANSGILRLVSDAANITTFESRLGIVNDGSILLESERSDRTTTLTVGVGEGIALENRGLLRAVVGAGGRRLFQGSVINVGSIVADAAMVLEVEATGRSFIQRAGSLDGVGGIEFRWGRFVFEGGAATGNVRLVNPDLSVMSTVTAPATLFVLGSTVRVRELSSRSATVRATTAVEHFTTVRADAGCVNAGRLVLDSARSDRWVRLELGTDFRNLPNGVIEVARGQGGDRGLNGRLVNQGRLICPEHVAVFTGTYEAAGGRVEGNVRFFDVALRATAATAELTELLLFGAGNALTGNVPENLRLRVVSDTASFSALTAANGTTNRGEIWLESERSDRNTTLRMGEGKLLENFGMVRAAVGGGGGRSLVGSILNRGTILADAGIQCGVDLTGRTFTQASGKLDAPGALILQGGRVRMESGAVSGTVRLINPTLSVSSTWDSASEVWVLGAESKLAGIDSAAFTLHATTDLGNFTILRTEAGAQNAGRIVLDSGRSDRSARLEFASSFRNLSGGRIEIVKGEGGDRSLNGRLVNLGRVSCLDHVAIFTGEYEAAGGVVDGDVRFVNATIVPTASTPQTTTLMLYGAETVLRGNVPQNLQLRLISETAYFTVLNVSPGAVNRGMVRLESQRSDRATRIVVTGGGTFENRGAIQVIAGPGGERGLRGGLVNFGSVEIEGGIEWVCENAGRTFSQRDGRIQISGQLRIEGGRVELAGGLIAGLFVAVNADHESLASMVNPATVDVYGTASRLIANNSTVVTYRLNSSATLFTTLRMLSGGVNRGSLVMSAGRSDRPTRLMFEARCTNSPSGLIESVRGAGADRTLEGSLVNQGRVVCTNHPAVFLGTYYSDGGRVEGRLVFVDSTIEQLRDVTTPMELIVYGGASKVSGDNLPNHRLRLYSDLGSFSSLTLSSNAMNRGWIVLDSERADRTSTLAAADRVVRNAAGARIVAAAGAGGGRAIAGAVQNQGRIVLENALSIGGDGAANVNEGVIDLAGRTLEVVGASFSNAERGRIVGSGVVNVTRTAFSNSGGLLPGASPGRLQVIGAYQQTDKGWLDVEIAGTQGPGSGHDILEVLNGRATLNGGRLVTRLGAGYVPAPDAIFRVLSAPQGLTGRFSRFETSQVYSNRFLETVYSAAALDLRAREGSAGEQQPPTISLDPESVEVDLEGPAQFRVVVDGTGPFTYQWRFQGRAIQGAVTDTLTIARARLQDRGEYDVVVSNARGSATSKKAQLLVKNLQRADCVGCDFGDAPDSYGTSLQNDGARHPNEALIPNKPFVSLGASVDLEPNSIGNAGATLDDTVLNDDEDGVVFTSAIEPGKNATVQVLVRKRGYEYAFLSAWVDFQIDGSFDAGDQIANAVVVNNGVNNLQFAVPANAVPGATVARFRLVGGYALDEATRLVGPKGQADNGEVEDHPTTITGGGGGNTGGNGETPLDYGDAPNSYRTLLAADGARHASDYFKPNNPTYAILGLLIDLEGNGAPTGTCIGDDATVGQRIDDEDGVVLLDPLYPGDTVRVAVTVNASGYSKLFLNAWVDFGNDGAFDTTDKIFSGTVVTPGVNTLSFVVPANTQPGTSVSRFRLTADNTENSPHRIIDFFGLAPNGEVEDYSVVFRRKPAPELDYGDAPEVGTFVTLGANDGARHIVVEGMYLGKRVDAEGDGFPSNSARGDDNDALDDEDGVNILGGLTAGGVVAVEVTASAPGKLEGWIDFNGNSSWADAGENVFASVDLVAGVNLLTVTVPANAKVGDVYARFRFSTKGGYGWKGQAEDGEVEDYKVTIAANVACSQTCSGTDFWLAFPGNQFPDPGYPLLPQLRIVGTAGNSVNVDIPGLSTSIPTVIPATGVANVVLPVGVDLGSLNDAVLNRGIHITTSGKPVSVYAISRVQYSSDGYLGLPVSVVGREYVVGAYPNLQVGVPELSGSQFVITATRPNTTVTITPPVDTGVRVGRVPFTVLLANAGDCYQLRNTNDAPADLTGTWIDADAPVSVFGGHQCTGVQSSSVFFCDYLVEQLPPVDRLATEYYSAPLATRSGGETIRVVAARDATTLTVDGVDVFLANKGDIYTTMRSTATWIRSDKPVYAAQYASSSDVDGVVKADPFMVTLPGRSHFASDLTFVTAGVNFTDHYINVVAPASVTQLTLDGVVTTPVFTAIGASGYRYAQIKINQGLHTLAASSPVGVIVYGWNVYESYAWAACLFFGDTTPPVVQTQNRVVRHQIPANSNTCTTPLPDFREGATATDNCGLSPNAVISQSPAPGTPVGVGQTLVTLSVTDAAGNVGRAIVRYVVSGGGAANEYTIQCPGNLFVACSGQTGAVVQFLVQGYLGCAPQTVETIPASGSLFPLGSTPVVARIIRDGQIRAECRFVVEVACRKRFEIKPKPVQPGQPIRELTLEFDPGDNVVEVANSVTGPWAVVPNAQPGMVIRIAQETGRFYRIR